MRHLAHKIFIGTEEGSQLLKLLKDQARSVCLFPESQETFNRYGGPLAWAAFNAGRIDFITYIEQITNEYEYKVISETKNKV